MCVGEGFADFLYLAPRFRRAVIHRGTDGHGAHVEGLVHAGEQGLVVDFGVGQDLVMVDLDDEGDLVGIFARHRAEHAQRRSHCVATAFDGQSDDVFRIEINRVGREGGSAGMLDTLVHRQDGKVSAATQASVVEQGLQRAKHARPDVFLRHDTVHVIGSGKMQ